MEMELAEAFRLLRHAWFIQQLHSHPCSWEWETSHHAELREAQNARLRMKYDVETERIIAGEGGTVAPYCAADMDKKAEG